MNVTGLVKYVGKLGNGGNTSSMFVGLKLDQPGKRTRGFKSNPQILNDTAYDPLTFV